MPTGPDGCPLLGSEHPPAGGGSECAILAGESAQFHAGANTSRAWAKDSSSYGLARRFDPRWRRGGMGISSGGGGGAISGCLLAV